MLVNIYPSSLRIIPDPSAVADCEPLNIEFTLYCTLIPTIDGKTFVATFVAVSE